MVPWLELEGMRLSLDNCVMQGGAGVPGTFDLFPGVAKDILVREREKSCLPDHAEAVAVPSAPASRDTSHQHAHGPCYITVALALTRPLS